MEKNYTVLLKDTLLLSDRPSHIINLNDVTQGIRKG